MGAINSLVSNNRQLVRQLKHSDSESDDIRRLSFALHMTKIVGLS